MICKCKSKAVEFQVIQLFAWIGVTLLYLTIYTCILQTSGSQTATENEDEELNKDESTPQLPTLDPTMQFLPSTHPETIMDEEETLGRVNTMTLFSVIVI